MLTIKNIEKIYGQRVSDDYVIGKIILHRYDYYIYLNNNEGVQKKDLRLNRILSDGDCYKLYWGSRYLRITKNAIEDKDMFSFFINVLTNNEI